jgi:hypothetical protein
LSVHVLQSDGWTHVGQTWNPRYSYDDCLA